MPISQSWVRKKTHGGFFGTTKFAQEKEKLQVEIMQRKARQNRAANKVVSSCCKKIVRRRRMIETPTQRLVAKN